MTITPVKDAEGVVRGFVAIKLDVTERQQAQEALARSHDELELLVAQRTAKLRETIEELEGFSYSLTHDMRAPLRAMFSFSLMLEEEFGHCLTSAGCDYLRRIKESAQRLDQLITDSLSYSNIVREDLALRPINLGRLLRSILETYPGLLSPRAQIQIEFDDLLVLGNESALTQCLSNLLGNAVKFVAPGIQPQVRVWAEPLPSPTQKAAEHPPATMVRIWIEDNGIGIPPDAHEKIFGMFQRLHSQQGVSRHRRWPGSGAQGRPAHGRASGSRLQRLGHRQPLLGRIEGLVLQFGNTPR